MNPVYLDWAATARPDHTILEEATRTALDDFGNPSSIHAAGSAARARLEEARLRCARALATQADRIVFTSGGSESNNTVLFSLLSRRPLVERAFSHDPATERPRIAVSMIEHACVWEPARVLERLGFAVDVLRPDRSGIVTPEAVRAVLTRETVLVAVMAVNNETGAIQPTAEIAGVIRAYVKESGRNIWFHVDAVQAAGKVPFSPEAAGADSASFSAHKIGGPRGAGLLYVARPLDPLYQGGGQERGIRPGTENLPGAVAIARALETRIDGLFGESRAATARMNRLLAGLGAIRGACVIPGDRAPADPRFSPWIVQAAFPGIPGEVLVRALSDAGFAVSTGAACSSRKGGKRRVLDAMGIDPATAGSAIRISQGWTTTEEEIDAFLAALAATAAKLAPSRYAGTERR